MYASLAAQSVRDTTDGGIESRPKSSATTIFKGQPGKAALFSLIIPGAGQVYNKRIWKVPFALALDGLALFNLIQSSNSYNQINNCYISLVERNPNVALCGASVTTTATAFRLRQNARTNRETAWIMLGGAHLLIAIEAFIDRHLINFDTSEDLTITTTSGLNDPTVTTFIAVKYNLSPRHKNHLTFIDL